MLEFKRLVCQLFTWCLLLNILACSKELPVFDEAMPVNEEGEKVEELARPSQEATALVDAFSTQLAEQFMQRLRRENAEAQAAVRSARTEAKLAAKKQYEAERAQGLRPKRVERMRLEIDARWVDAAPRIKHGALLADLYENLSPDGRVFVAKEGQLSEKARLILAYLEAVDEHALERDDALIEAIERLAQRLERMEMAAKSWSLVLSPDERLALAFELDAASHGALEEGTNGLELDKETEEMPQKLLSLPIDEACRVLWKRIAIPGALVTERAYAAYTRYTERLEQIESLAWALEWVIADAYLNYAEQMKLGNLEKYSASELERFAREDNPGQIHPKYYDAIIEARLKEDFLAFLDKACDSKSHLESLAPQHPQYAKLQLVRERYRDIVKAGAWHYLKPDNMYIGGRAPLVTFLKRRLEAEGYVVGNTSELFDDALVGALKAYQRHHQFDETGELSAALWRSLNVSAEMRLAEIEANIRRWHRTMYEPRDRYIYINVPSFEVELWDAGERVALHKTVVGSSARFCNARTKEWEMFNATVLMHARMTYLVFNPYWNVPPRIEVDEYQPRMEEDPEWLESSEFEYHTPKGGGRVFRQKPGPNNALGRVKFIFPNRHNIYLHDTPKQLFFSYPIRAFSHGCIRVEEAFNLAKHILDLDGQWDEERIERFYVERGEHPVELKTPIDVFIEYHTVSVDDDGMPHFLADIYRIIKNEIDPPTAAERTCDPSVDRTSSFRTGGTEDSGP